MYQKYLENYKLSKAKITYKAKKYLTLFASRYSAYYICYYITNTKPYLF